LNAYSQIVGRPRQFDETTAVATATAVFRERGFSATSVDHLVEATGMHRGSLYGTFGSKHGLFLRVLDAAAAPGVDPAVRLDVVLVALLELAPTDARVRGRARRLIEGGGVTDEQLGDRLLARAGLRNDKESA
jgi:TetR/AcrR family transcriptional repressor of nem operon